LIARLAVLIVVFFLLPVAGAQATTYCVNTTGADCDVVESPPSFQQALDDARNMNPGPDTIKLGSNGLTTPGGFLYNSPIPGNTVAIIGAGGRNFGQSRTSLSLSGSPNGKTVLTVTGAPGSTISGIGVEVAPGANTGIHTNGTVSNVAIEATIPPGDSATGITLEDGGALIDSDASLPTNAPQAIGVFVVGANTTVDRSTVRAAHAIQTSSGAGGVIVSGAVRRSEIIASVYGIEVDAGNFVVEDTVLRTATDLPLGGHHGVRVSTFNGDNALALNHVTMVGTASSGVALSASASGSHSAGLSIRNSVLSGYGSIFQRNASGSGPASISTDFSDYTGPTDTDSGPGSITETNHLTADPGFVSGTDFRLRSDSAMIDAGDPAGLAASESPTDASGRPRIVDGGGDCVARRDVGAFEFQPGPRAPVAVANVTTIQPATDQPVQFDASQSCDPDGDALSYVWSFDDGSVAEGVTRERAFSRAGLHFAAVTVTDSTGRSTTAVAAVRVTRPPVPPFAGVTIPKQTVKVSKSGVAGVKLRCPLGTVGACAGKITLSRAGDKKMGTATVAIARGATRKVSVKLTRRSRTALKKARRLNVIAAVSAHDTNGTSHRTKATIKLVAPRS
jgi:hypothetical protein